jgi:hypothetical protein
MIVIGFSCSPSFSWSVGCFAWRIAKQSRTFHPYTVVSPFRIEKSDQGDQQWKCGRTILIRRASRKR